MRIHGLQKLTLLDFPGKTACTVFTGACNFRCPFCHNASLVLRPEAQPTIPEAQVLEYLRGRRGLLDGVCVTGGEPTLQPDLLEFLGKVKHLGFAVKLDTNGWDPEQLAVITDNGLCDMVAMDIKSSPAHYAEACGVPGFDTAGVEESVRVLRRGTVPYEFRTTVVRGLHTVPVMEDIGRWLAGVPAYYLQAFRDSGDLVGQGCEACSPAELRSLLQAVTPFVPNAALRGVSV